MYKYWQIVQKPQDFILRFGSFHTVTEFMSCSSYGLLPKLAVAPRKFKYVEREQRNWVNKENWELWYRLGVTEVNTTVPCRTEGFKTPKLPVGPDCTASLI